MTLRSIFALLLSLTLAACASPTGKLTSLPATPPQTLKGYQLGTGDRVRLVVGGFANLSIEYRVSDVGTISLPMLGPLNVAGKTTAEVEKELSALMRREELAIDASVNVQVEEYRPFYITGEVKRAGAYPYVPGMNVLNAITIAGGSTFRADTKGYEIQRAENGNMIRGRGTDLTQILPGDTIVVHETWF